MNFDSLDVPAAGKREVEGALLDAFMLLIGVLGLAISLPPLIFVGAAGHIAASFWAAPSKPVWLAGTIGTAIVLSALLAARTFGARYCTAAPIRPR